MFNAINIDCFQFLSKKKLFVIYCFTFLDNTSDQKQRSNRGKCFIILFRGNVYTHIHEWLLAPQYLLFTVYCLGEYTKLWLFTTRDTSIQWKQSNNNSRISYWYVENTCWEKERERALFSPFPFVYFLSTFRLPSPLHSFALWLVALFVSLSLTLAH